MSQDERTLSHDVADKIMYELLKMDDNEIALRIDVGYEVWALLKMLPYKDGRVTHAFIQKDQQDKFMGVPLNLERTLPEHEFTISAANREG